MKLFKTLFIAMALSVSSLAFAGKVNINTADADTIASEINGIGKARAQAIVEYRKANGKFSRIEDLARVKGVGEKTIARNRDKLSL